MKITRTHYNALKENYIQTRHLMSVKDQDEMKNKLDIIRKELAFESCISQWENGETINCMDFIIIADKLGVELTKTQTDWIQADIIEVGKNSYSCIDKLHKTKEKNLKALIEKLSVALSEIKA